MGTCASLRDWRPAKMSDNDSGSPMNGKAAVATERSRVHRTFSRPCSERQWCRTRQPSRASSSAWTGTMSPFTFETSRWTTQRSLSTKCVRKVSASPRGARGACMVPCTGEEGRRQRLSRRRHPPPGFRPGACSGGAMRGYRRKRLTASRPHVRPALTVWPEPTDHAVIVGSSETRRFPGHAVDVAAAEGVQRAHGCTYTRTRIHWR